MVLFSGGRPKGYAVPESKAATIAFLQGLFDQYLTLKGATLYRTSVRFRRMVNRMPHDLCYEPAGCDLDLEMSAEAQWQGRRLGYCKFHSVNVVDANLPGNSRGPIHVGDTNYRCVDCDYLEASSRLPYFDTAEVAEMLNVSASTVRKHIKRGGLEAFLVERHPRLNLGEYIAPRKFLVMRKEAHAYRKRYQTRKKPSKTHGLASAGR